MTLSGALPLGLHNTLALPRATMLAGLGSVLAVRSVSELAEVQKRSADKQRWLVFDNEVELLSRGMTHPEPCMAAMALHGVLGGCMGVVVGLFLGTYEAIAPPIPMPGQPEPPKRTIMQEVREGWRRSGIKARSWGKNFAGVTLIWSGMECGVEKLRGAHDVYNAAIAGCATGAAMAAGQGPEAMCFGCVVVRETSCAHLRCSAAFRLLHLEKNSPSHAPRSLLFCFSLSSPRASVFSPLLAPPPPPPRRCVGFAVFATLMDMFMHRMT